MAYSKLRKEKEHKMKKFIAPLLVVLLVGITCSWYFGHYRPTLESEPVRIYKTTSPIRSKPSEPTRQSVDTSTSEHSVERQEDSRLPDREPDAVSELTDPLHKDTTSGVENVHTVSQPGHREKQHTHSQAEIEAERAETEAILARGRAIDKSAQETLENGEIEKLRMADEMANHLTSLSLEEQRAQFELIEKMVYHDLPHLHPGEDTPEDLDKLWNSLLSSLILVGYTPPEGVSLK